MRRPPPPVGCSLCRRNEQNAERPREGCKHRRAIKLKKRPQSISNSRRNQAPPIIFTQEDVEGVHFRYCDALLMILDHDLTPTTTLLYGFTGDSITLRKKITLAMKMGESPQTTLNFMEFLIVDSRPTYHEILRRPALKKLGAVTSIHHLCMKFSTKNEMKTVRSNQRGLRECYLSSIRKAKPWDVNVIIIDMDMIDVPGEALSEREDRHEDMMSIDPKVSCHHLKIDFKVAQHRQKRKALNPKRYEVLKEKVQKLIKNDFIREAIYPKWVSNSVLVKKHCDKWRVCIDFTNLNKACPKDSFPLPRIDQLVDSTIGRELLSFMDAYSSYNQISMYLADEKNASFITDRGLYCYKMMPSGLKMSGLLIKDLSTKYLRTTLARRWRSMWMTCL
ncbi:uncharacterized protein LOC111373373 [Olea europaea var. sylvestris]|uniref:uncharacterized protein LOC111373373 n=1 Tax=Olea europaea var. sylvestris TaxID=158386 RepID=UPI000C1D839A|nr:uncharacterized protein LOC111373373 [Olea europaea var. sylvestris]